MKKTWMLGIIVTFVLMGLFVGSLIDIPVATSAPLRQITTWATTTPMQETLSYHGAVVVDEKFLYVSGGDKNPVQTDIIPTVRFAAIENNGVGSWNLVKELPIQLFQHAMVAVGNYLYVIGGWDGGKARADVFRATVPGDGKITQWVSLPNNNYSSPINFHDAVVVNNFIYVVGGRINNAARTDEVRYAPVDTSNGNLGSWTLTGTRLPDVVSAGAVAAYNGYIYVTGGFNGTKALDTVYYAPINQNGNITTTWKTANFTPAGARYFHEALVVDGKLIILGGTNGSAEKADVWAAPINIDGSLGAWGQQQPGLPESLQLQQFAAVSVDQGGGNFLSIVLGGRHGAEFRNQVYVSKYMRPTPTPTPTPGLKVFLSNDPPRAVESGSLITYTITYSTVNYRRANDGDFTNVTITNAIPVVNNTPLAVTGVSNNGQKGDKAIVWQVGGITTAEKKALSYTVRLEPSLSLPSVTPTAPAMPPLVTNRGAILSWSYSSTITSTTSNVTFNNAPVIFMPIVPRDGAFPAPTRLAE